MSKIPDIAHFDPNSQGPPKAPEWATYSPDRRSKPWKLHDNRGHALNAMMTHGNIALYHFDGFMWRKMVVRAPSAPERCDWCRQTTMKKSPYNSRATYNRGEWVWEKLHGKVNDALRLLFLCQDCSRENRSR